ncbi:FAD-dependent oxidoreductase [Bradyrhizobium sp.]|uniref:FAD-dependent oxidoreductase n=1 Tax=Bradyrhizobium sp. TaxID=376 RepID=UPI002BDF13B1|nr:FAD-dependent oxidoreductase [Bradyrhizobium sp.]HMM91666.1 FAD-dependent oxidoreductase [Bradyrhizobium sp.]
MASSVCDVLVIGSGAAGMATAIVARDRGLDVLIVERAAQVGGATARSGGWLWVPGNPLAAREGAVDPIGEAKTYIQHEAGNHYDEARVDAFLYSAGRMVAFFEENTEVKFAFGKNYPDYHPDHPGGAEQGRSIHTQPFDGKLLGEHLPTLALPMKESTFMGMGLNSGPDLKHFLNATRSVKSAGFVASRILAHGLDVLIHRRGTRLVNGNALSARLFKSALDRRIPIWLSTRAIRLTVEDGAVAGALVERDGKEISVRVRRGVVLASGGFPHDEERKRRNFKHWKGGAEHASLAPDTNTGDAIRMAEEVDAAVDDSFADAAAWVPVSLIKRKDGSVGRFFHLIDRAKPGVIAVTRQGRRFTNESDNYHDFVRAMIDACDGQDEVCGFVVCDHRTIRRYGLGAVRPAPLPLSSHVRSGYLKVGRTIRELAVAAGINADRLERTVEEVNRDAKAGHDSAFGRGRTSYQRLLGDSDFPGNPCIGDISSGPFYAVKIIPGDIATYHGLVTDAQTRVLNANRQPIGGLYAVGNDAASIFGGSYPGAGATLGPAMTFGFICANNLASDRG